MDGGPYQPNFMLNDVGITIFVHVCLSIVQASAWTQGKPISWNSWQVYILFKYMEYSILDYYVILEITLLRPILYHAVWIFPSLL